MIYITDEEALNWPLDSSFYFCTECGKGMNTHTACGYCGYSLCDELSCIKSHAAKGCYTNHRHAEQSSAPINQHPTPDAGEEHHTSHAKQEPVVDAQAVEE